MSSSVVPFSPLPLPLLKKVSRPFFGVGAAISSAFPYLGLQLEQAGIGATRKEYCAVMVFLALFYFAFFLFFCFLVFSKIAPVMALQLSLSVSAIGAFLVLVQVSMYPVVVVKRKVREIESNLVFALRTMLVQIKSGVSLFSALNVVAAKEYGELGREFKKAVDEINTGTSDQDALQKMATQNPSLFLRKALWQLVSGMKSGSDISTVLEETVSSMIKQQSIEINKYGAKLRLMSLFYMMIGVVIPALGITFLIVLGSFPQVKLSEMFFWSMLGLIVLFEFMFLGMIKSQRPSLMG